MILIHRKHALLILLMFIIVNSLLIPSYQELGGRNLNISNSALRNPLNWESNNLQFDQNYVIFVEDKVEYEEIKQSYNVLVEYPNLLALEVFTSYREFGYLSSFSANTIIPSQLLREHITKLSQPLVLNQGIETNTVANADHLKVSDLWDLGYNGTDVVVAMFDDGIDFSHLALQGQNFSQPVLFNESNGMTAVPCKDHGTQVAGLLVGTENAGFPDRLGTAFGSKLVSMEMGCGTGAQAGDLIGDPIAGFDWLAGQNETIKVVNLSWSSGNGLIFEPIINRLARLGIITVTSAGNNGPFEYSIGDPGSAISSIAVGAINDANIPQSFSSLGPNPNFLIKPDVVAPGYRLTTTTNGGGYTTSFSGTSGGAPLVSGAIATLISGLNANNITWNVGTIKAAIMRSATLIPGDENKVGQGLVNMNATWNYLINTFSDNRGPQVLEITPSNGIPNLFSNIPTGITVDIPITMISSHPDLVNIEISGNLSQLISINGEMNSDFSQVIALHANTINLTTGIYLGIVNATLGDDFVSSEITIRVTNEYGKKVLVDLRHTNWDTNGFDYYGGSNTGEMVKLALNQNFWVQDSQDIITDALLDQFDILWMPDPLDLWIDGIENPALLLQSEITAITNFVNSGGSLFIDFLGTLEDSYGIFQTNSTAVNSLISQFGITARNTSVNDLTKKTIFPGSNSPFPSNVTSFTHFGNYLDVENSAKSIAGDAFGTVIATFESISGGLVFVSSTNFWLDNTGALGLYTSNGGLGDRELSINTWKWLSSNERTDLIEPTTSITTTSSKTTTSSIMSTTTSSSSSSSPTTELTKPTSNSSDSSLGIFIIIVSFIIIISSYHIQRRIK
ncbi:MAG: Subtilisin NAT precursor [Candidatus Heimdallarchaeota archaeon LC_2]|nr:MAG: Subtilisin NAT precursor [Candidatus Heimdallarchaeota archaeon LC_2]